MAEGRSCACASLTQLIRRASILLTPPVDALPRKPSPEEERMKRPGLGRIGAIVAICALVGALAGIAGSAAAPTKKSAAAKKSAQKRAAVRKAKVLHFRGRFRGPGPAGAGIRAGGPPVHSEAVVPNAAGDGFDTITMDNGKLKSADGSKLTVTEGTDKKTYGEPTIDVGSDAKVFRN